MKKKYASVLCFVLLFVFSSCSKGEFINLVDFVDNYNSNGEEEILLTDFLKTQSDSETNIYFSELNSEITLIVYAQSDNVISHAKVIVSKLNEKNKTVLLSDEIRGAFLNLCQKTICAFCQFEEKAAENILNEINISDLNLKETEKLFENGSFRFIYFSNELCSEFIIYNKWLYDVGETLKPESKAGFPQNPEIRKETVPHR